MGLGGEGEYAANHDDVEEEGSENGVESGGLWENHLDEQMSCRCCARSRGKVDSERQCLAHSIRSNVGASFGAVCKSMISLLLVAHIQI